jgi:hypothetical protein
MDVKRHMLVFKKIFILVDRKKQWGNKMEVVIKKGESVIIMKIN